MLIKTIIVHKWDWNKTDVNLKMTNAASLFSDSHCVRSGCVFCGERLAVRVWHLLPTQCGRAQVYFCGQSADRRLHRGQIRLQNRPAQGELWHSCQIPQRDGSDRLPDSIRHLQRHTGLSRVPYHMQEDLRLITYFHIYNVTGNHV